MKQKNESPKGKFFYRSLITGLAIIIGFLYGLPHLLWLNELNWDYKNAIFISQFLPTDACHYIVQIKEIYEGNYRLSNSYLVEHKDIQNTLWPVLPFYLTGFLGKLLHIKVQCLAVLMDFTLPPITFLLASTLLLSITKRRNIAILGAFFLTLTPHLFKVIVLFLIGFRLLTSGFNPPILANAMPSVCFARTINPQLTYSFLLASILFFFKGITSTSKNNSYFLGAIAFGVFLSYSYVFFSTYLYTFLGIGILLACMMKKQRYAKWALIVLTAIIGCSLPFWYSIVSFSRNELYQMTMIHKNHTPIINREVVFLCILCGILAICIRLRTLNKISGIASLSFLIGSILCINQQLVTGMRVQPHHYMMYVLPQSAILALTLLAADYRYRNSFRHFRMMAWWLLGGGSLGSVSVGLLASPSLIARYISSDGILTPEFTTLINMFRVIMLFVGIGLLITGILLKSKYINVLLKFKRFFRVCWQFLCRHFYPGTLLYALIILYVASDIGFVQWKRFHSSIQPDFADFQTLAPALQWLDTHTKKESVILSMITGYDWERNTVLVSTDNVIPIYTHNNVYLSHHAQYYTVPSMEEIRDRLYNLMSFMGISNQEHFERFVSKVMITGGVSFEEFQEKLEKDIYAELKKYQVDYLFWGPREKKSFLIEPAKKYSFLREVYNDENVTIYQIL